MKSMDFFVFELKSKQNITLEKLSFRSLNDDLFKKFFTRKFNRTHNYFFKAIIENVQWQ